MLGLVLTLMMAAAVLAVLWPLSRARALASDGGDAAVYRSQLDELERERGAGMIEEAEIASARVEFSRRLLAAVDATRAIIPGAGIISAHWRRRMAAVTALVLMPAAAGAIYIALGSPTLPGQPIAARENQKPDQSLAGLIARVEARLAQNPEEGRGWEVIAPAYMRLGRFDDAVRAQANVVRLLSESATRRSDLGEALVAQANGVVTSDARAAFELARSLDPQDARAQFYIGLAAEQDGRIDDAAQIWRRLMAAAAGDAPWLATVKQALARIDAGADQGMRVPSPEEIAASVEMPPAERDRMVRAMVERLAERLHADGSDVDGWLRLMRAYMMLGNRDQAHTAAIDARQALHDAPEKLRRIEEGVRKFGVDG